MNDMLLTPVILCGGSGTRLWPLSRQSYPKQFLAFNSRFSLFQETARRFGNTAEVTAPLIVTNTDYRFLVAEQLRQVEIVPRDIILEPIPRNTAPAIAAAAFWALRNNVDATLLVLPSDHFIADPDTFLNLLPLAYRAAQDGTLVTFGIVPDFPHTGYGYIQRGKPRDHQKIHDVEMFVEKPSEDLAKTFLANGDYLWNSGMFVFRADCFLKELKKTRPDIYYEVEKSVQHARNDLDFIRLSHEEFAACPSDSIDYAVMEHTSRAAVITAHIGWSDVGSWAAISEISASDENGNNLSGDVVAHDVTNCLIRAEKRLVAASGIRDLIVVETADAVLVTHKNDAQGVKRIVAHLNAAGHTVGNCHTQVYRPWGHYENIDMGDGFQVKRILVNPGAALSLQLHHHRAEHWIVVKGTASIRRGGEEFILTANQSTYIPVGEKHRLENKGTIPLEVIEIQSGSYLGEDDIVRFEDIYGRN